MAERRRRMMGQRVVAYIRNAFGMDNGPGRTMLWVDQDKRRWVEYRLLEDGMFELVAVGELPVPRRWKGVVG